MLWQVSVPTNQDMPLVGNSDLWSLCDDNFPLLGFFADIRSEEQRAIMQVEAPPQISFGPLTDTAQCPYSIP